MEWKFVEPLKDVTTISKVEKELQVKFPAEFVDQVKTYNNGAPTLDTFDTPQRTGKAFGELLNFNLDDKYNILHEYSLIKDKLRPGVIPFAGNAGGNYLCFDYQQSAVSPSIVYWDHEQLFEIDDDELIVPDHKHEYEYYSCEHVADNLTALFEKLYTEDIDYDDEVEKAEVLWETFMDEDKLIELNDENLAAVNARRVQQGLPPLVK